MEDVESPASPRLSNGKDDLESLQDDSDDLISEEIHINHQSSSPVSDEPGEPLVAEDRSLTDEEPIQLLDSVDRPKIEDEDTLALQNVHVEKNEDQELPHEHKPVEEETKNSVKESDHAASSSTPNEDKRNIDTSAPIESVLDAVSKFGGFVGRKAHKTQAQTQTPEKSKISEEELEKAKGEIPVLLQQTEAAEEAKAHALKELEATNRYIEELKQKLEKAQAKEQQAKQDSEIAKMRLKEMEKEQGEELQLGDAKAVSKSELEGVKEEVEALQRECKSLLCEKDAAVKRTEEDLLMSKEIEKTVEEMSLELADTKERLEAAQIARMEDKERRNGEDMIRAREAIEKDKEMKQAEEDMERLKQQVKAEKQMKVKLKTACDLLASLKSELHDYKELRRQRVEDDGTGDCEKKANEEAKKELEALKLKTEKTREEVRSLKEVFEDLNQELDLENLELESVKQREGVISEDVGNLKAELERMNSVIAAVRKREKEGKIRMEELPMEIEVASQEANEAKSGAKKAREKLREVQQEAEQAKERDSAVERRLIAVQSEMEAARDSEKDTMSAIKELQERESNLSNECGDPPDQEAVALEEYNELSKRAQEAEEQADAKADGAMAQVEDARKAEMETVRKLEEANEELLTRKEVYEHAAKKAEKENEAKIAAEQELARWSAENEQRHKDGDGLVDSPPRENIEEVQDKQTDDTPPPVLTGNKESTGSDSSPSSSPRLSSPDMKAGKKKKKHHHYFPRFFTYFTKKKAS